MSDLAVIEQLEHELGIAGHEADCSLCRAQTRIAEGRCHGAIGDDTWHAFECPHQGVEW